MPLLQRELLQQSAKRRTYVYRVICAIAIGIVGCYGLAPLLTLAAESPAMAMGQGKRIFDALVLTQFCIVYGFLPAYCSGLISQERERDTFSTLLVTKLSPVRILIEKLLSRLIPFVTLLLLVVPLMAIAFGFGGFSQSEIWWSSYLLVAAAVQVGCISIACSSAFRTSTQSFVATYVLGFGFLLAGPILLREFSALSVGAPDSLAWFWHFPLAYFLSDGTVAWWESPGGSAWIWLASLFWLFVARIFLVRRTVRKKSQSVRQIMRSADRVFEFATGWKLRNTRGLPELAPIAWRDSTRGVLGNIRYQLYAIFFVEVAIIGFCAWQTAGSRRLPDVVTGFMVATFLVGVLVISAVSTSLFSGERSNQTLGVLLTTPLTNKQILEQKFHGLRNLILLLLIPFLTFTFFFAWEISSAQRDAALLSLSELDGYYGNDWVDYSRPRFLFVQLSTLWIYPNMIAWLGIYVGMRFRRTLTALTAMLLLLSAWCVLPFLVLVPIFISRDMHETDFLSGVLFISPLTVPGTNLFGDVIGSTPWLQAFVSAAFYFGCWQLFRRLSFAHLEHSLGRKCEDEPRDSRPLRDSKRSSNVGLM